MKFFFTTLILYTFCGYENSINAVRNVRNLFPVKTISRISKKITEISVKLSLILNVPSLLNMIIKNVLFSVWVRRALWGRVQPTRLRWWIAHHLLLSNLLLLQGLWRQRKKMLLKVISRFHLSDPIRIGFGIILTPEMKIVFGLFFYNKCTSKRSNFRDINCRIF